MLRGHRRRRVLLRIAALAFLAGVGALIARQAAAIDWPAVADAVARYRPGRLAAAAALVALSYLLYCGYEVAARRYAGHAVPLRLTAAAGFVGYAFNLSLGALIGGGGVRYRLYSRAGLRLETVLRIAAFAVTCNWLGWLVLAGGVLLWRPLLLPERLGAGVGALPGGAQRAIALALLCVAAGYLLACARWHGHAWSLRGRRLQLPTLPAAALQLALSTANWLVLAALIHVLLQQRVAYPEVLTVMLVAAVAAAMVHVPAGLGALEAVFLAMLSRRAPQADLLAALAVYRALYHVAPLLLATLAYWPLERRLRALRHAPAPRRGAHEHGGLSRGLDRRRATVAPRDC
ncbi:lysylphosphatidylglycerol synthase domain-containing protein [Vulcaniibacterium tengchongense]|uniref:Lysylphosphatidylglycerol synthase-like protein n=1 Tax=Vulcaniibacterium tengchongense TaxID=1273429 RepID=A0A3N4VSZ8_9GAMM|nr:lysylphosphatidylglycerol synthase domain-containing protein [Vulcaniibacterium tengchongense]RPE76930.1 hypothetical protein EDC50_2182 [Vulcaniibacterium tengchongense]